MALPRLLLCFVLTSPFLESRPESNICNERCICLGYSIDCSNTSSFAFAELPEGVKSLDLSSNKLTDKTLQSLGYHKDLAELKLSHNLLTDIPLLPSSMNSLTNLVLSHNEISMTNLSTEALNKLPSLKSIDLSFNLIRELPTGIFPNHSLQLLNLNGNFLKKLDGGQLEKLSHLEDLRISRNKLKHISKDAFKQLKSLLSLDLNRNQLFKLESLMFQDLMHLSTLRLRRNDITYLKDGVFWGLKNISSLFLDHNNVSNISNSWLYGLDSLIHLNLSHNHINHMDPECWSFNSNLLELDLSHNLLLVIGKSTFNHLFKLQKLKLNLNRLVSIEETTFNCTPELVELELYGNDLSWAGEEMNGIFNSLSKLKLLNLAGNRIKSINTHAFDGVDALQILNLANNSILSIQENPWGQMRFLRQLSLNISSLMCDCSLGWLPVWLSKQPFASQSHASCAYPHSLQGKSIMDVPAADYSCDGIPNPHIVEEPKAQMVLKGANVTLHCRANSSSDEAMVFRWKRDNVELMSNMGVDIKYHFQNLESKEQVSNLHIYNASLEDNGVYQCMASNSYGSVHSSKASVSVVVFPKFTKIPEDLKVKTGSIARLPCAAEGLPEPKMSWQKDGGNDFPAARERRVHVIPDDDVFFIVNVKPFDTGIYSCMARNDAGVNITNASLTVLETPSFVKHMENKDIRVGQAVVLECVSTGSPKPHLKWRKDGVAIRPSERHHFAENNELLIIRNTQPEDAGRYECELTNLLGTEKGYSKLTIIPASGSIISNDDLVGIIIITVVCCAVCTSVVWVIIIYQTRKHMARSNQSAIGGPRSGIPVDSPMPLLVYGRPSGQLGSQVDTDSEHSSGKDSGTGDSDKRSRSNEDLLPPLLPSSGRLLLGKGSETGEDCIMVSSDGHAANASASKLVGPARSPVKAPPFVASVKPHQRQRRTNHDRLYRLSMSTNPPTATVHTARPSSYHCIPLAPSTPPPPQPV